MRPPAPSVSRLLTAAASAALLSGVGCHHRTPQRTTIEPNDTLPPIQVTTGSAPATPAKPMPGGGSGDAMPLPPGFPDPALVRQEMPEEPRFVAAYGAIGRPRLLVFVNRTVTGELVPVAATSVPRPGLVTADAAPYLQPGQYDMAAARSIDYELIENILSDDLAADGKVTMIAPLEARQRLSEAEVQDVQSGRPQMLGELATKLNADVLVQVTARPSQQTAQGLAIRLVAEALNTHGGQAIAFASVDLPAPLTKPVLNEYVRFVARKLMDGMSTSWESMGPAAAQPPATVTPVNPPPAPAPVPLPPVPTPTPAPPPPPAPAPTPPIAPATPLTPATPTSRASTGNPLDLPPPP